MKNKPGKGEVRIFANSSLRKLKRTVRRGLVPAERQVVIDTAIEKAGKRRRVYMHAHARRSAIVGV